LLIETGKLNDVEPQAYIADVLDKLVNLWPASRMPLQASRHFLLTDTPPTTDAATRNAISM
jgi:hypothetical protein